MRYFLLTLSRAELATATSFLLAAVGLGLTISTGIAGDDRPVTFVFIGFVSLVLLMALVVLIARPSVEVIGYGNVMRVLERYARNARHSIWTVRTHSGTGHLEKAYFTAIDHRVRDLQRPLTDFRRLLRISGKSDDHLKWLVERFWDREQVEVYGFAGHVAQFDFMIVDSRLAVIGFPLPGGRDNAGAIVIRGRESVRGIEAVALLLQNESVQLFEGGRYSRVEEVLKRVSDQVEVILSSTPELLSRNLRRSATK